MKKLGIPVPVAPKVGTQPAEPDDGSEPVDTSEPLDDSDEPGDLDSDNTATATATRRRAKFAPAPAFAPTSPTRTTAAGSARETAQRTTPSPPGADGTSRSKA